MLCTLDRLCTPTVVKRKDDGQAIFSNGNPPEVRHSKFSYTNVTCYAPEKFVPKVINF